MSWSIIVLFDKPNCTPHQRMTYSAYLSKCLSSNL